VATQTSRNHRRGRGRPNQGVTHMKKYLIAAALIVGFSVPALAVETFYIMFDNTMKGKPGACSIMTSEPTDKNRYKMMGKYGSKADAETAMHSMKDCA
jgi:hypothetical protein